jgi:hypothetical protein
MTFITLFRAFISRTGLVFLTGAMCLLPGATIAVNGTGDPVADGQTLQNAVNSALPGDVISVQPGFSYQGQITLPAKTNPNGSYITIQSAAPASSLPAAGVRTGPAFSAAMPQITSGNGQSAFVTDDGASYYQLVNLEFPPIDANTQLFQMLLLGNGTDEQTTLAQAPQHLIIDRCYFHGFPNTNWKQAIQLNSGNTDIINSYFSDFHSDAQESHDINVINGPGPFNFINNYFEAAGVNVLFGGAVAATQGLVPSNILFKGNDFTKNLAYKNWDKVDPATYADAVANHPELVVFFSGSAVPNFLYHTVGAYTPQVKNHLEFKTGQDIIVEGNTFTNCWVQADQFGVPIVITPRTEGGAMPWATTQRINFTSNVFQHTGGAVLAADTDPGQTAPETNDITLYNNLFDDLRTDYSFDFERTFTFTHITNLRLDHNTFLSNFNYQFIVAAPPEFPSPGYNFTNNITVYGQGFSSDCGFDVSAFACALVAPYTFTGNIIIGGNTSSFPTPVQATTYLPASVANVGFVNAAALGSDYHNYALAPGTLYKGLGTHNSDPGFIPSTYDIARNSQ